MLVNVRGGLGHELEALQNKYPQLPGLLVLEDLEVVIRQINSTKAGFQVTPHDFFTPQPSKVRRP